MELLIHVNESAATVEDTIHLRVDFSLRLYLMSMLLVIEFDLLALVLEVVCNEALREIVFGWVLLWRLDGNCLIISMFDGCRPCK
jgi:hypothetical protein